MKLRRWLLALIAAVALAGSTGCCMVAEAVVDALIDIDDDDDDDKRSGYSAGRSPSYSAPRHEDAWRGERVSRASNNW